MELTESTAKQELPACPVETTLTLISDKWKVLILRDLINGTLRFGELKKSIGHVTQKVLTAQLRQMEASQIHRYQRLGIDMTRSPHYRRAGGDTFYTRCLRRSR